MNKKISTLASIGFVLCMFTALGILLFVQLDWIDNLYENELWRLKTDISQKTIKTAAFLEDELLLLANLTKTRERNPADLENALIQLISFWEENAYNKDLLSDIYFGTIQDISAARKWSNGSFVDTNIPDQEKLKKSLVSVNLPRYSNKSALYISFDDNTELILSTVSPFLPTYYLIAFIDNTVLSEIIIPHIVASNFPYDDIYRIRVLDTQTGATLYVNDENPNQNSFTNPDFTWVLFETIFQNPNIQFRQMDSLWSLPEQDYESGIDIPLDGFRSHYLNSPYMHEDDTLLAEQVRSTAQGQIIIEIVHRDGSVLKAARGATRINFISSISIIVLLIFGFIFLLRNLTKSVSLARKQQEFIATVTHELKTPVSVIYSSAQNMADGIIVKPEKIMQYGKIMKEQSIRLSDSIDYFLLYSQVHNSITREHIQCNLNELVNEVLTDFSEKIQSQDFTIKMRVSDKPILIYCDKIAIKSVVQNLIGNALKHACDGKYLEIKLQTIVKASARQNTANTKKMVLLSFSDRGQGIPHKEQKQIFEAFERGSNASAKQIDGSGIGLNLVKRILEQHDATIHLHSIVGKGSIFTINFPFFDAK